MTLQDDIKDLSDTDFRDLKAWIITTETNRRQAQPAIEQAQADIVTELQEAGKLEKPEVATEEEAREDAAQVPEWKDPGTSHALMYHYGDVVRYQDKLVRSTHRGLNHWEPSSLAFDGRIWEVIDQPETPEAEETPKPPETSETEETEEAEAPESGATAWAPGLTVKVGDQLTYQGATYQVIQPHTTQAGWEPPAAPSLWKQL